LNITAFNTSDLSSKYIAVQSGYTDAGLACDSLHLYQGDGYNRRLMAFDINSPHSMVMSVWIGRQTSFEDRNYDIAVSSIWLYASRWQGGNYFIDKYSTDSLTAVLSSQPGSDNWGFTREPFLAPTWGGSILFAGVQDSNRVEVFDAQSLSWLFSWNGQVIYDQDPYYSDPANLDEIHKFCPNRIVGPAQLDWNEGHLYLTSAFSMFFNNRNSFGVNYPFGVWRAAYRPTFDMPENYDVNPSAVTAAGSYAYGALENNYAGNYDRRYKFYAASMSMIIVSTLSGTDVDHDLKAGWIPAEGAVSSPTVRRLFSAGGWQNDAIRLFEVDSITGISSMVDATYLDAVKAVWPLQDNTVLAVSENFISRWDYDTRTMIQYVVVSPGGGKTYLPDYSGVTWSYVNSHFYVLDRANCQIEKRNLTDMSSLISVGKWGKGAYEFKFPTGIIWGRIADAYQGDYKCREQYPVWFGSPTKRGPIEFGDIPFRLYQFEASSKIYLTDADRPVYWLSNSYEPSPIQMDSVKKLSTTPVDNVGVSVSNVDRKAITELETMKALAKEVYIYKAYWTGTNSFTTPYLLYRGHVEAMVVEEGGRDSNVRMELRTDHAIWAQHLPRNTFAPRCQWRFKSNTPGCQYSGVATVCDRSWANCLRLGNVDRFRGFRHIEPREREIWWGKGREW
jgi:hypothetical protein